MREPDNERTSDATLGHVVPRWSDARSRYNLVAIHARIGRASRRGRTLTLALAGAALCAGSVAVAAVIRMHVRKAEVAPAAATAGRAEQRGIASRAAEPAAEPVVIDPSSVPSPAAEATAAPAPATRVVRTAGEAPDVEALMRSADAARRAGHPAQALPYLRRLLRDHPADARAPLAAFTLGRILLAELDRPAEAADAFALSRRLAPGGPMASHALAREVEAAARSGDAARARRLAETYLADYPAGPHLAAVKGHGGIE
jgi:TolA-binding protein